ncbi:fibronectin type III domain-containing protein [Aeromicrobium sp. P5_D10]
MGSRSIIERRRRSRVGAALISAFTTLALVLGLAPAAQAASDISVYVTFEGYNIGQGYYVEPVKVTVPEGSTAAAVTESVLDETSHQFTALDAGDTSSAGWYLSGVKGFDKGTANVPSYITSQPGFELTGTDGDAYLGTPDYNSMSGWMYTVNNVTAQVGAGALTLHDGDVMRWQFTLYGYGCDLGLADSCWESESYFSQVDKTDLIRGIGKGKTATATDAELATARTTAVNPTATQQQVTASLTALNTADPASSWVRLTTTAQGQFLTKLREKLVSDFGQTAGDYDYSVVKKLSITGTLNAQDYTDLRNASYAGTSIEELDLSGAVDATTYALSGMTALTDVSLPPVANYTVANPFQGNSSLRNVVVAAETYTFGSTTTFNGITTLERITFLHTTKPSLNASTFNGSNNADPDNRTVKAVVPNQDRGDYDKASFSQYFAGVTEKASAADLGELETVTDEAKAIGHGAAAAEFRWTLLQDAITKATTVHDDADASAAAVYGARLALQTAISRIAVAEIGLSLKVTHGADVTLSWKNGTAQHFAEHTAHPLAKVDSLSNNEYDIYVPTTTTPYTSQHIASAVIPGTTDKVAKIFTVAAASAGAQYTLDLTPLAGRQDTAWLIPGLGAGDNRGLYTNLDDTGVLNLDVGDRFDLDTIRTQQAQLDQINNLFVEPDYKFELAGDSVTTRRIGQDGRRQLRIKAESPGVSVVKITYGPLHYLAANDNGTPGNTNWSFNGIDPQNTGVAVVNVGGNVGTFDTGINVKNELDTFYFDKTAEERDFTFTPADGTTVRVHDPLNVSDWGDGWNAYDAASDGSVTVKLKGGRNIVELKNDGKVQYRVVRAKGVDVTITNTTNPGQSFAAGDNARIAISGIEGGVEKLAGIYNPAFSAGTKGKLTYYDGATQLVSNEATQYQTAITTFNINYTYTGTGDKALNGDMFIGGLGAEWPFHRHIPLEGKPANLAAVAIGPYHFGGLPTIYVHGNKVTTSPDAPSAPTGLQVTHANASAELSWTAPTSTGGQPVIGYNVRYSRDGGDNWTVKKFGTATSQTLTGLTNGTEYEVQVAAVNSSAIGTYTASQKVTPRTVPGVPSDLELKPLRNSVKASWTAPSDGGSTITGYRVRFSADSGENWTTQSYGTATSQTLTGLTDGTSYDVQVAAINAEGAGFFTDTATAKAGLDKTALTQAIASAQAKDQADYTTASWSRVATALTAAQAVAADAEAGETAVAEAIQALNSAVAALHRRGAAIDAPIVAPATIKAKQAGAAWLARELASNDDVLGYGANTDWGLTADAVFALAGAGVAGDQIAETADAIYHSGSAYTGTPSNLASRWPFVAKTVLALQIAGLDPSKFPNQGGTRDLVADLRSAVKPDGSWQNTSDSFKTSLGILALARTEEGVPAAVVDKFEKMACSVPTHANYGAFGFGGGCSADVDTTAMAVQALLASGVSKTDPAVARPTDWMLARNPRDGFPSQFGPGNTNTSGLAAQALFAVGKSEEAKKAASFIEGLQIGCSTVGPISAELGAVAYNAEGWSTAMRDGIGSTNRDQWRRASAQAVLGLGAESLGFLSAEDADPKTPQPSCSTPSTGTKVSASAGQMTYGKAGSVTVTVAATTGDAKPTGKVSTKVGGRSVAATLANGKATLKLPATSLKPGTRSLTVSYSGADGSFGASSKTVAVKVVKAKASVKVKGPKKVKRGKTATYTVTVTAPGIRATGKVTVKVAGKSRTVTLNAKGKAVVKVKIAKGTKPGRKTVTVTYRGDTYVGSAKARKAVTQVVK